MSQVDVDGCVGPTGYRDLPNIARASGTSKADLNIGSLTRLAGFCVKGGGEDKRVVWVNEPSCSSSLSMKLEPSS